MTPHRATDQQAAIDLNGGGSLPVLGLGVWLIPDGRETVQAVRWAFDEGYRHIDTAQGYENETGVGRAVRESGLPRDEVFVATKFAPANRDPERAMEDSLRRLGLEYVDLYLVHWPERDATWAWPAMQRVLERGLTRAIGVSNFTADQLDELVGVADVPPAVNQVRLNPFAYRRRLVEACERHGIAVEAYSPLTHARDLDHPAIAEIARRVGHTPAQVLLRWGLQHGFAVIPKSARRERIAENARIFDFELSEDDVAALDALDRTGGAAIAVEEPWWS
jgi:2,5-diketo-D-gluconate reductase A